MAGSYRHATTEQGNLRSNESFAKMVENLGDAYETVEEMYGMIWALAHAFPDPKIAVGLAEKSYKFGLEVAKKVNTQ